MGNFLRRTAATATVLTAVAGGLVGVTATAQAANTCPAPYFCLYYNSNQKGAIAVFFDKDPNFANDRFSGSGNGVGEVVKNNAASARNNQTGLDARVWFNSNYGGVHDLVARSSARNLTATYNDNASFDWRS